MSQDELIDYDVISPWKAPETKFGRGVSFQELTNGTTIETPVETSNESIDEAESEWWTQDELLKNLEDSSMPSLMGSVDWNEKIPSMEPLIPDQVYKRTIKNGVGPPLKTKNAVLFHVSGYVEGSDEPFDSSVLRGRPMLHRLDREDLLPGVMIGVLSMRLYEKAEILVRPLYGFGDLGCPPRIPEKATLIYVIEILRVFEEGSLTDYELMTPEEIAAIPFADIITKCNEQRISGNTYFSAGEYRKAAFRYSKAIKFLERYFYKTETEQQAGREMLGKLYPNNANALIRIKKLRAAMVCCRKALDLDPNNVKALCQYGKAKFYNGDYDIAKSLFKRAYDLKPQDSFIASFLVKINQKLHEEALVTQALYKKMAQSLNPKSSN